MRSAKLLQDIENVTGPGGLLHLSEDINRYAADGRGTAGKVLAVARPATTAQVVEIVRLAAREEIRLVPQGARTGLVGAGVGDPLGDTIVLSLERMARKPLIDARNRTAEADAGLPLSALNEAAGAHGLFFPIDLGADPSVGGMIAANTGGARFLRYGDVRRNLLGIELVTAEAEPQIVSLGGALWKNNSGLDLKHLFVGSSGSLGIVTRATLALSPKPGVAITAMLALATPSAADDLLMTLEQSFGTLLTAFEGMSAAAMTAALDHVPRLRAPFPDRHPGYTVLVELSAGPAFDAELLEERLGATLMPWLDDGTILDAAMDRRNALWSIRHAIPEGLRAAGTVVACDIALRRGDVMRFREDVAARIRVAAPQLVLHDFGHIGDGGMHFNLVWPTSAGSFDPEVAGRAKDIIFTAAVTEYGGSFSAEHGVGPSNIKFYERFTPPATLALAGAVQRIAAPVPIGRVDFGGGH